MVGWYQGVSRNLELQVQFLLVLSDFSRGIFTKFLNSTVGVDTPEYMRKKPGPSTNLFSWVKKIIHPRPKD